jgi:hypothetical protein
MNTPDKDQREVARRIRAVSRILNDNPRLSRDYATGFVDAQLQSTIQPHEVAETIARAIEPHGGAKSKRREALIWAAGVARSLYPKPDAGGVE